jgi:hypothetical protein
MIIVRNVFQIHADKMKDAVAQAKRGRAVIERMGMHGMRAMTDVTGAFYTLVLENECKDMAEFEQQMTKSFDDDEWQKWYRAFAPFVHGGYREIFHVLE